MEKINFEDLPSTNTPLSAYNLNRLQGYVESEFTKQTVSIEDNTIKIRQLQSIIRENELTQITTEDFYGLTITAYRIGKLCFVNVYGSGEQFNQYWKSYTVTKLQNVSAKHTSTGTFINQNGQTGSLQIEQNSNAVLLNFHGVTPNATNSWIRGQLVFVCN